MTDIGEYYVYCHVFPNNKKYIGITRQPPEKRWLNGNGYQEKNQKIMYRAIQKYGWKNIRHYILHSGLSEQQAKELERYYITKIFHSNETAYGYNQTKGGDGVLGYHHSDSTKNKISNASKRMWTDCDFRKEMSKKQMGENNSNYGKKLSESHKQILSECAKSRTGNKNPFYGKAHSVESKRKISKSRKGKCAGGNNHNSKKVLCIDTGEIFDSTTSAAKAYHMSSSNISSACRGDSYTAGGYHWKYIS